MDGLTAPCLKDAGCEVRLYNHRDVEPLPAIDEVSGIVSLGGEESATDAHEIPYLTAELELLRAALDRGVPVLGMCLGAQMLAAAAGGRVYALGHLFLGWPALTLAHEGTRDPVFGGLRLGLPVLEWHNDAIQPPPGATLLGETRGDGAALFRIGATAWGSQAHLEVSREMLFDGWLTAPEDLAQARGRRLRDRALPG